MTKQVPSTAKSSSTSTINAIRNVDFQEICNDNRILNSVEAPTSIFGMVRERALVFWCSILCTVSRIKLCTTPVRILAEIMTFSQLSLTYPTFLSFPLFFCHFLLTSIFPSFLFPLTECTIPETAKTGNCRRCHDLGMHDSRASPVRMFVYTKDWQLLLHRYWEISSVHQSNILMLGTVGKLRMRRVRF